MDVLLKGLCWHQQKTERDIRIRKGVIAEIGQNLPSLKKEKVLQFDHHFVYPGLINAHDHLEMNLYPKLGTPPYGNYAEWGSDIYKPLESPIKEIEKINIDDRLVWGGIKNILSGVTTVVHHNPWKRILSSSAFPLKVLPKYAWSHSLANGKNIQQSFPSDFRIPFIIHAAEGVDALAFSEIKQMHDLGLLKANTVLIHCVALSDQDIEFIHKAKASVVWCPASNFFLFSQTAPLDKLKGKCKIALGSDSTLTGSPTLLEEMKFALQTRFASAEEIFGMVTAIPAQIFNIPPPSIEVNSPADLLVIPALKSDYVENLLTATSAQLELVMVNGEPRFGNEALADNLGIKKYFAHVSGVRRWFYLDVLDLKRRIEKKAGKTAAQNPLWNMLD